MLKISPTYQNHNIFSSQTPYNPLSEVQIRTSPSFESQILGNESPKTKEYYFLHTRKRNLSQNSMQIKNTIFNSFLSVEERSIEEENEEEASLYNIKQQKQNRAECQLRKLQGFQSNIFGLKGTEQMNGIRELQLRRKQCIQTNNLKLSRASSEHHISYLSAFEKKKLELSSKSVEKVFEIEENERKYFSDVKNKIRIEKFFMDTLSNNKNDNQQKSNIFEGQLIKYYKNPIVSNKSILLPTDIDWVNHDSVKFKNYDKESNHHQSVLSMTNKQFYNYAKEREEKSSFFKKNQGIQNEKSVQSTELSHNIQNEQQFQNVQKKEVLSSNTQLTHYQLRLQEKAQGFNITQFKAICENYGFQIKETQLNKHNKIKISDQNTFTLVPTGIKSNIHQIVKNLEKQNNHVLVQSILQSPEQLQSYQRIFEKKRKNIRK